MPDSGNAPTINHSTEGSMAAGQLPIAGFIRRLLAMVYDGLLLLGITFAYLTLIWIVRKLAGQDLNRPLTGISALLGFIGLWLVLAYYFVLCWTRRGQTLGMKTWRLRLQNVGGGMPSARACWLRCLLAPVSLAPAALGYLWSWYDRQRGAWHDIWTHTRVVVIPKVSPPGAAGSIR